MSMGIVHRLAVELIAMFGRVRAALRVRPVISLAIVIVVIYVAVEVFRTVKPGACADEHAA